MTTYDNKKLAHTYFMIVSSGAHSIEDYERFLEQSAIINRRKDNIYHSIEYLNDSDLSFVLRGLNSQTRHILNEIVFLGEKLAVHDFNENSLESITIRHKDEIDAFKKSNHRESDNPSWDNAVNLLEKDY